MARATNWGRIARDVIGGIRKVAERASPTTGGSARPTPHGTPGPDPAPREQRARDPRRGIVDTVVGRVEVDYAPWEDGNADPGEIVWAWVAYEDDPSQGKDRPLLVIGHLGQDVAALAMTTRGDDDDHHHAIGSGAWDRNGRPSWIKLDRIIRLDPEGIRREGSVLPRDRFDAVVAAWQSY